MSEYIQLRLDYNKTSNKKELEEKLGKKCGNCGSSVDVQYHHIVPLALGGTNKITNMAPLCYVCHQIVHGSRNIRRICASENTGRKRNPLPDNYENILDDYLKGNIGRKECEEKLNVNGKSKLSDRKFFKEYIARKGIRHYRNNVDTVNQARLKNISENVLLARIEYCDGTFYEKRR